MTDPLIYKDEHGCHVRIDRQWRHNLKPYLARCLLKASGFPNAAAIVRNALCLRIFDFSYDGNWIINGRKVSEEKMKTALEQTGLDDFAVETIIRIHKNCYERQIRLNRLLPDSCSIGE
ncbi:MAG TPA: hypothetical protein VIH42_15235 [Thermoguttaceae bacterium]